jgi:hypothetical protein
MSGRRNGRKTKSGDDLTAREADVLALIERAGADGILASDIDVALGVTRASTNVWLHELARRGLAHGYRTPGVSMHTPFTWLPGPAHTGPTMHPMFYRVPSIFAVQA